MKRGQRMWAVCMGKVIQTSLMADTKTELMEKAKKWFGFGWDRITAYGYEIKRVELKIIVNGKPR